YYSFFFQAEDGIRDGHVTGVQTCALPISGVSFAQLRWEHYHDQLVAARAKLTPAQTDSAYHAGDVRLFQHILVSVPPSAASKVRSEERRVGKECRCRWSPDQ